MLYTNTTGAWCDHGATNISIFSSACTFFPGWIWGCISERSSAQNSDSNKIWRTFLAQIDRKYWFGAEWSQRSIWHNNLAKFGEAIKHLCISIFEIMIWEEWKAKFRKFGENFGYFRKPHIFSRQFSWCRFYKVKIATIRQKLSWIVFLL